VGSFWTQYDNSLFEFSDKSGFNPTRLVVKLKGTEMVMCDSQAVWEFDRTEDVWFVKSVDLFRGSPNARQLRDKLVYESFSANLKVDPKQFQFEALQLPSGSRIIYTRSKSLGQTYNVKAADSARQQAIDDVLAGLSSGSPNELRRHRSSTTRIVTIAVGVTALLRGAWLLWRYRRIAPFTKRISPG
jgi:hypothetical protein